MYSDDGIARLQNINRLIDKRDRKGGLVIGFHGTSASRAANIALSGFIEHIPSNSDGIKGVYFWDDEYERNAFQPGRNRAQEDGDSEFSVIEACLQNPAPDYKLYRPQWRSGAVEIGIIAIRYYDLLTGEMQQQDIL